MKEMGYKINRLNLINCILIAVFILMILINIFSFTKYTNLVPGVYLLKYLLFFIFIVTLSWSLNHSLKRFDLKYLILISFLVMVMIPSILNTSNFTINSSILLLIMSTTIAISSLFIFTKIEKALFILLIKIMFILIAIFIITPNFILTFDQRYYYISGYRTRFIGFFNNTNELARFIALGFLIGIRILPSINNKIFYVFTISMMIASVYIILLTNSRAALLLIVITLMCLLFIFIYKKTGKLTTISLLILAVMFVIIFLIPIFEKFNIDYINDLSSGRINIWQKYLFDINNFELFFGTGSERIGISATRVLTNGYLEILLYYGVFGLLFWIGMIIYLLIKKTRFSQNIFSSRNLSITIVTAFLVYYLFEGGLISVGNIAGIYFWMELSQNST